MLTPYLFNPVNPETVEAQIEYNDKIGKPHQPRDLSGYLEKQELVQFQRNQSVLSMEPKALDMTRSCIEIITRALISDEGLSREQAEQLIYVVLGSEKDLQEKFQDIVQNMTDPVAALLETAGKLHCEITRSMFTAAMRLNLEDFRALFPERYCIHEPDLVIQKLVHPDFKLNNDQRKQHFAKNKELSFSILNALSTWEIAGLIPMQSMQVLQNAARYNVLKAVFSEQPQQNNGPQPVQLQNELNGTDV